MQSAQDHKTSSKTKDQVDRVAIRKIINGAHTAFMVTLSQSGVPHGRPMATAEVGEELEVIYFAAERNSTKTKEIDTDPHVFLGYVNGSGSEWATIVGKAKVVDDRSLIKEMWSPIWKNWFEGPDDPEIVLIAVTHSTGEYWDQGNKVIAMAKLAFTAVTGVKTSDGDHGRVAL